MRKRLLVTGFGPFPGISRNPSGEIARAVAASSRWRRVGVDVQALVMPTTYAAIDEVLAPALRKGSFDAVLMIGVAGRSKTVRIEKRAANRARLLSPDAAGKRPTAMTFGRGPSHRTTAGPAARLLRRVRAHRLPCVLSQDAGGYLCNAGYFAALEHSVPVVFIHIPRPPRTNRRAAGGRRSRTGWHARLAAAFVDVGLALMVESRRRG